MDPHEHACEHNQEGCHGPAACHGMSPAGCRGEDVAGCTGNESCGACTPLTMPQTDEQVTLRATDLATLLDLVEAYAGPSYDEDGAYTRSLEALQRQAPLLVGAREQLLATFREMAARAPR